MPKPPLEWMEDGMDNDGMLAPQPLTPQGTGWSQAPQGGFAPQGAYNPQQQQQQQALGAGGMFGGLGGNAGAGQGGGLPPLTAQGTGYPRASSPFAPQPQQPGPTGGPSFMPPQSHSLPTGTGGLMPPASAPAPLTHQLTGWTNRGPSPVPPAFQQGGSLQGHDFLNPTPNGAAPIGAHNAPGATQNAPQYGRGPSPGPFNVHPGTSPSPALPPLTAQGTGYPRQASPNPFLFSQAASTPGMSTLASQQTGYGRAASPGPFDSAPALPPRPGASPLRQQPTGYQRQPSPFGGNGSLPPQQTGYGNSLGLGQPPSLGGSFNLGQRNTSNASTMSAMSNMSSASFQSNGSCNPYSSSMQQPPFTQQQAPQPSQPARQSSSIWDDLADLSTPQQQPGFHATSSFNDSPFDFGPSANGPSTGFQGTATNKSFLSAQPTGAGGSFLGSSQNSFLSSSQASNTSNGSFMGAPAGRTPGKAFVPSSSFGKELAAEHGLNSPALQRGGSGGVGGGYTPSPGPFSSTPQPQSGAGGQGAGGSYFPSSSNGFGQQQSGGAASNPFFGIGGMAAALPNVQPQQPQQTGMAPNPFDFGGQTQQPNGMYGGGQPNGGGSFYGAQQPRAQQQQGNPFDFF